jgi:cytidylate kinase
MSVVTISRWYGAGGRRIAEGVAEQLGYRLVHREIVEQAAMRTGLDPELASQLDERAPSLIEDIGLALAAANPELGLAAPPLDDRVLAQGVRRVMESLASTGGYVIVGRGGAAVLKDTPGACHVQIVGRLDDRARNVSEWQGIKLKEALELCKQIDAERASFVKRFFGSDIRDQLLYDMTLNTSRISLELAEQSILALIRARADN